MTPAIALIVPTLNEAGWLPWLLDSTVQQTIPFKEIVVTDGGSTDGTQQIAAEAGASVLTSPPGRGRQIAAGIDATTAPIVLVLHADARCDPQTVAAIGAHFERFPDSPGGCLGHRFDRANRFIRLIEWFDHRRALRGISYGDQGQFFQRAAINRAGGFPDVPIMEDVELSHRLAAMGTPAYLDLPILCSARGFDRLGVFGTIVRNLRLRRAYRRFGPAAANDLYRGYYDCANAETRSLTNRRSSGSPDRTTV